MNQVEDIERLIASALMPAGYDLVRVCVSESGRRTLQLMVERLDGVAISVNDCATVSKTVSVLLDAEDPISGHYDLEVSSPGIDRPLIREEDFNSYLGFDVEVQTKKKISGQKKFCGRLVKVTELAVSLSICAVEKTIEIPFLSIKDAKLSLTEDLLLSSRSSTDNE